MSVKPRSDSMHCELAELYEREFVLVRRRCRYRRKECLAVGLEFDVSYELPKLWILPRRDQATTDRRMRAVRHSLQSWAIRMLLQ